MFNGKMLKIVAQNLTDAIDVAAKDYGQEVKNLIISKGEAEPSDAEMKELFDSFISDTDYHFTGGMTTFFLTQSTQRFTRFMEASKNPDIAFYGLGGAGRKTPSILYAIAYYAVTGKSASFPDCKRFSQYAQNKTNEALVRVSEELEA